jgi:hypothetical protein
MSTILNSINSLSGNLNLNTISSDSVLIGNGLLLSGVNSDISAETTEILKINYNTPKPLTETSKFKVYNNSTDRDVLFEVYTKGTLSGTDRINIPCPIVFVNSYFDTDATSFDLTLDHNVVEFTFSGNVTVNLPAVSLSKGKQYTIIKSGATGTLSLNTQPLEYIDDAATSVISLTKIYDKITVLCGTTQWYTQ